MKNYRKANIAFAIALSACICNADDEYTKVPINVSLVHGISVGESISTKMKIETNVMLNVLTGRVDSLNGVAFGSISNQVKEGAEGAEFAGIINSTGKQMKGFQAAGICNIAGEEVLGAQSSGIYNYAGNLSGVQLTGILNHSDTVLGFQESGIINRASTLLGAQASGIVNKCDNVIGIQASGITNIANNISGLQITGIANIATGSIYGAQIAGIVNRVDTIKGVQIGLINIANHNDGAAIGLISIDKSYAPGLMMWTDENHFVTTALRTGNRNLYNLLSIGVRPDKEFTFSVGMGFGTRIPVSERFSIDVDYLMNFIGEQSNRDRFKYRQHCQRKLRLFGDITLYKKLALFGGISGNALISEGTEDVSFIEGKQSYTRNNWNGNRVTLTPGFFAGLRIN